MLRPAATRGRTTVFAALMTIAAAVSPAALAELAAVVVDRSDDSLRVVGIDSGDGSITPGSAAIPDCCRVGAGLTAADPGGERFFVFGRELTANGDRLATLGFDGASASSVVPARVPQVFLVHDAVQGRLVSVELGGNAADPTVQWFSIDPATGSAADIGPPDEICCELMTGVAGIDAPARRLFFVGREFGQAEWRIRSVDLATGTVSDIGALPTSGRPGFLRYSGVGDHLDLYMQDGPSGIDDGLYRVDPATGTGQLVSAESDSDCCLLGLGQVADLDASGEAWWLAGSGGGMAPAPGFMALFAGSDNGTVSQWTTDPDYALHALVVDGAVVSPGMIFRDRFEAP